MMMMNDIVMRYNSDGRDEIARSSMVCRRTGKSGALSTIYYHQFHRYHQCAPLTFSIGLLCAAIVTRWASFLHPGGDSGREDVFSLERAMDG